MEPIVNERDTVALLAVDPLIARIMTEYGPPPSWSRPPGFVTLSRLILEQQVSLASAHAHFLKLNAYMGEFTPDNILRLGDDELRACQISRQKSTYLRALSAAVNRGTLNLAGLEGVGDDDVRSTLTAIKGIGQWTADVYLLFCLQRKDVLPIGDVAVVNTIKELTGLAAREEMVAYAERWRPYRSLATYFLWHHYLSKRNRKPPF